MRQALRPSIRALTGWEHRRLEFGSVLEHRTTRCNGAAKRRDELVRRTFFELRRLRFASIDAENESLIAASSRFIT